MYKINKIIISFLLFPREQLVKKLKPYKKFSSNIIPIQMLAKLSELLCLSADYILFGECPQGNSIELTMLSELCLKCPADKQTELLTIVHAFVNAVSKS